MFIVMYMHTCIYMYIYNTNTYIYTLYMYIYIDIWGVTVTPNTYFAMFLCTFVVDCVKLVCIFLGYAWLTLLFWNDAPGNLNAIPLRWVGAPKISRCLLRKTSKFEGFSIGSIYVSAPT